MEKLQAYLAGMDPSTGKRRRKYDFAASIGIAPTYLSQLLSGHRQPSLELMKKIKEQTGGEVGLDAWG